jgi:hypothetical protein
MFSAKSKSSLLNGSPGASGSPPPAAAPAAAATSSSKFGGLSYFSSDSLTKIFKTPSNFVQTLNSHISFGSTTPTAAATSGVVRQQLATPNPDEDKPSPQTSTPSSSSSSSPSYSSNNKPDENVNYKPPHNVEQKSATEHRTNNNNNSIKTGRNVNNTVNSATQPTVAAALPAAAATAKQPVTSSGKTRDQSPRLPVAAKASAERKTPQPDNLIKKDNKDDEPNDDKLERCQADVEKAKAKANDKRVDCHDKSNAGSKHNAEVAVKANGVRYDKWVFSLLSTYEIWEIFQIGSLKLDDYKEK